MSWPAVRALFSLGSASFISAGAAFVLQIFMARLLSIESMGQWAAAWVSLMLASSFAAWGVGGFWLKAFGQEQQQAERWLLTGIRLAGLGCLVCLIGWGIWVQVSGLNLVLTFLVLLAFNLPLQVLIELTSSRLQTQGQYGRLALWQLLPNTLRLLWVIGLFWLGSSTTSMLDLALGYALIAWVLFPLGGYWLFFAGRGGAGKSSTEKNTRPESILSPTLLTLAARSTPFALAGVVYLLYFHLGILFLYSFSTQEQVALYQVALVLLSGIYLIPSVVFQKFLLARFHHWAYHDPVRLKRVYHFSHGMMLVIGCVILGLLYGVGPWLLPWLFGQAYQESWAVLAILAWGVPLRFMTASSGALLSTQERMPIKVKLLAAALLVQMLLAGGWIPMMGAVGAAWALVIGDAVLLIGHWIAVRWLVPEV